MQIEIPVLKRCCCCVPLRRGLLFWVYLQLAFGLFLLWCFISSLVMISSSCPDIPDYSSKITPVITVIIVLLMDIAFCILFLISAHRKNHEYMRIYYKYAIAILIIEVIALLGNAGYETYRAITITNDPQPIYQYQYMVAISFAFAVIVLQAYLVLLVRSEVLKLEKRTKVEFINHTNEPECKAQI